MDFVYLVIGDEGELEDFAIYLSEEEAIERSIKSPKTRIDIFSKSEKGGYLPTTKFYLNGVIV